MDLIAISLGFIVLLTLIHCAQTQDMYDSMMHTKKSQMSLRHMLLFFLTKGVLILD